MKPAIRYQNSRMKKRFFTGFLVGFLLFVAINLLAAHLLSDCGLPSVFGMDYCADDIARAGWPFQFFRRRRICLSSLFHFAPSAPGYIYWIRPRSRQRIYRQLAGFAKGKSARKIVLVFKGLCYNTATMPYQPRFANDNNNNNNDARIVGRSFAG